jgi:hypothetical protein
VVEEENIIDTPNTYIMKRPDMKSYLSLVPAEKTDYNIAGNTGPQRVF